MTASLAAPLEAFLVPPGPAMAGWRQAVSNLDLGHDRHANLVCHRCPDVDVRRGGFDRDDEGVAGAPGAAVAGGLVLPPAADEIDAHHATLGEIGSETLQVV